MDVCLVARDTEKMTELAAGLSNTSVRTQIHPADLRQPDAARKAVEPAVTAFGPLDLIVNNADATRRADFFALTEDDWQDGFALQFHGYVRMTRAAWPHLRASKGSVVNIVGIGSRSGSAEVTIGGSVNVALLNFTKAMADTGVEQGLQVNAINPGQIEADRFTRNVERTMRDHGVGREDAVTGLLTSHKTKRVGRPDEVGALTAFPASENPDFIQGAIIDIDGGATRSL